MVKYILFCDCRRVPVKWWCWGWPEGMIYKQILSCSLTTSHTPESHTWWLAWGKSLMTCYVLADKCAPWKWTMLNTLSLQPLSYFQVSVLQLHLLALKLAKRKKDKYNSPLNIYKLVHQPTSAKDKGSVVCNVVHCLSTIVVVVWSVNAYINRCIIIWY